MRKILVCCSAVVLFALASPAAQATGGKHGNGHHKTPVCHKPGTPAEKTLYLPAPAHPGHLGHGDYEGVCKPPAPPPVVTPPVKPPVAEQPCVKCPPPPCPPTQTTTTVIEHVTVIDHGLPAPPTPTTPVAPCVPIRDLLFYSPNGKLGRTTVSVGGKRQRVINVGFRKSAIKVKGLDLRGEGTHTRLTIKSVVRKGDVTVLFRWSGLVRRCGGWLVVDPVVPKAKKTRSSWG
jgi:hypothetical protein